MKAPIRAILLASVLSLAVAAPVSADLRNHMSILILVAPDFCSFDRMSVSV